LCGFEKETPCALYYYNNRPTNYTIEPIIENINLKAGYNQLNVSNDNIKLYDNNLFIIVSEGGATVLNTRPSPYSDIEWDDSNGLPVYCLSNKLTIETCSFPYRNTNINIRFSINYSQDNYMLVKYKFTKRYYRTGTFNMVTSLLGNDNVQNNKTIKISNSFYDIIMFNDT
jgi:hypothetical protein